MRKAARQQQARHQRALAPLYPGRPGSRLRLPWAPGFLGNCSLHHGRPRCGEQSNRLLSGTVHERYRMAPCPPVTFSLCLRESFRRDSVSGPQALRGAPGGLRPRRPVSRARSGAGTTPSGPLCQWCGSQPAQRSRSARGQLPPIGSRSAGSAVPRGTRRFACCRRRSRDSRPRHGPAPQPWRGCPSGSRRTAGRRRNGPGVR